ncbi:MAG: nucleoside triphosphate pyrophosphohydrolase [Treponema sp.]|nr:nucleoside triphosphate pyrophosphohydrolase [Treponema sp.]
MNEQETGESFARLYSIIKKLRAPDGCPWDKEQTPKTMRSDLIEETFEAVDAITENDIFHVKEELGDVFLNAAMIAYMNEQLGNFSVKDTLNDVSEKIIRRHPHVFPNSKGKQNELAGGVTTAEEVLTQWDNIKRGVENRNKTESILDEVPKGFPPLMKAYKMHKKAAKAGFDWNNVGGVFEKLNEELEELKEAVKRESAETDEDKKAVFHNSVEDELGDILSCIVNIARHLKIDPNIAMEKSNKKFYRRFSYVEAQAKIKNKNIKDCTMNELEYFWQNAKQNEKQSQH